MTDPDNDDCADIEAADANDAIAASADSHAVHEGPVDEPEAPSDWHARSYLVLALVFGLVSALFVPPSQVLDEAAHWSRVWQLSNGNIIADSTTDEITGYEVNAGTYPACVQEYMDHFVQAAQEPEPFHISEFWQEPDGCNGRPAQRRVGEAMGTYSVWSYPGQVVGVSLGRLLHLPIPWIFHLGRLCGLALTVALGWFAIRMATRGKGILMFVGLAPIALMGSAGYSADGIVISAMMLAAAYATRFSDPRYTMTNRQLALLVGALSALILTKPPYVLMLLLLLCFHPQALGSRVRTKRLLGAAAGLIVLLTVIWSKVSTPAEAVLVFRPGVDQAGQLGWILGHPGSFASVVFNSFLDPGMQNLVLHSWIAWFSMFRTGSTDEPHLPTVFSIFAGGAVAVLAALEHGGRRVFATTNARVRSYIPALVIAGSLLALYAGAYIAWDRVGSPSVYGVQGRYFLPLLVVLAPAAAMRSEGPVRAISRPATVLPSVVLLCASVVKALSFYY